MKKINRLIDFLLVNYRKSKKQYLILILILVTGVFLRAYNLSDWYIFKADQSRDARYMKEAYDNGPSSLRLLGPKVDLAYLEGDRATRGYPFRLGPIYYYIHYFTAVVFRSVDPWIMAVPDLIASSLAILLFYFFAKIYFKERTSLIVTGLFSTSFYLIQYSRFSWNPNQLIFWELLLLISLYKSSFVKDRLKAGRWVWVVFLCLAILSQIHILGALGFPLIVGVFWIIYRPRKIRFRYWIFSALTLLFFYTPVIVSDVKNDFDNTRRFIVLMTKEKDEIPIKKRVRKLFERHGEFYGIALTSFHEKEIKWIEELGANFFIISLGVLFLVVSSKFWRKRVDLKFNLDFIPKSNPFFVLIFIWISVYLFLFSRIVDDLNRARYFLVVAPIPFLFIAFWIEFLKKAIKKRFVTVFIVVCLGSFLASNLFAVYYWFDSLSRGDVLEYRNPKMGYHDELITLGDLKDGLRYVNENSQKDKNLYFSVADYQYKNSLYYLQELYYPQRDIQLFGYKDYFENGDFFMLTYYEKGEDEIPEEYIDKFKVLDSHRFDMVIVWHLEYIDPTEIASKLPLFEGSGNNEISKNAILWKDLRVK